MIYIGAVTLFVSFIFFALLIGYRIIALLGIKEELGSLERIVFSFAFGVIFISFLIYFLGLMHILYFSLIITVIALALLLSLVKADELIKDISSIISGVPILFKGKLKAFLSALILISLLLTFIGALAPAKGSDALVYHLADAKYFAKNNMVTFIPYTARSVWPYFMQMLFTLAMFFGNALLAKLFHLSMAVFCGLAVYSFSKRFINKGTSLLAAAIFFLTPGVYTQATYAYVDLGWAFYGFLSFYALLLWNSFSKKRWLIVSAFMAGIAANIKYIGLVTPFMIFVMIVALSVINSRRKGLASNLLLFSLVVGVVILPYYVRPYLYKGNILYPFYVKYIAEKGWYAPYRIGRIPEFAYYAKKNLVNLLRSIWLLTFYPQRIYSGGESQLGPVYLAFLPALFFIFKKNRTILAIMLFISGFYLMWFFAFPAIRFILPIIPFLALLVGYVVWSICNRDDKFANLSRKFFAVFLLINFSFCFYYNREEITFFIKGADVEGYMMRQDRSWSIFQYINKNTPIESEIMLVDENRSFYLDRPSIREDIYRIEERYDLEEVDEIIAGIKRKGITHLLYYKEHKDPEPSNIRGITFSNNTLPKLMGRKSFVNKYMEELVVIEYSAEHDPSQEGKHILYKLI